ncbi:hypothetical protein BXY66_3486 [Shimia isoporae]|uniref:Uncharacterized protein n=1 Tax=Shimia isoporae TaxID=647720 RepID=A0A4V2Q1X4_9RHOB|nr:hypothetical protein BXY66_3486 [Shimia isoporae]
MPLKCGFFGAIVIFYNSAGAPVPHQILSNLLYIFMNIYIDTIEYAPAGIT